VQSISDSLVIKNDGKVIYTKYVQLQPLQTFADSVKIDVDDKKLVAALGANKLVYNTDEHSDDLQRPVDTPKDFDWNTAYGLMCAG
jgi:hypothetical protein